MLIAALLQQLQGNQDISQEHSSVGARKRAPMIAFLFSVDRGQREFFTS